MANLDADQLRRSWYVFLCPSQLPWLPACTPTRYPTSTHAHPPTLCALCSPPSPPGMSLLSSCPGCQSCCCAPGTMTWCRGRWFTPPWAPAAPRLRQRCGWVGGWVGVGGSLCARGAGGWVGGEGWVGFVWGAAFAPEVRGGRTPRGARACWVHTHAGDGVAATHPMPPHATAAGARLPHSPHPSPPSPPPPHTQAGGGALQGGDWAPGAGQRRGQLLSSPAGRVGDAHRPPPRRVSVGLPWGGQGMCARVERVCALRAINARAAPCDSRTPPPTCAAPSGARWTSPRCCFGRTATRRWARRCLPLLLLLLRGHRARLACSLLPTHTLPRTRPPPRSPPRPPAPRSCCGVWSGTSRACGCTCCTTARTGCSRTGAFGWGGGRGGGGWGPGLGACRCAFQLLPLVRAAWRGERSCLAHT